MNLKLRRELLAYPAYHQTWSTLDENEVVADRSFFPIFDLWPNIWSLRGRNFKKNILTCPKFLTESIFYTSVRTFDNTLIKIEGDIGLTTVYSLQSNKELLAAMSFQSNYPNTHIAGKFFYSL